VVKNKFFHLRPPRKTPLATPGKKPSDNHAYKHVKLHHFCEKLCCITPSDNTVQQHQCGQQAIAGWQTMHGIFCQTMGAILLQNVRGTAWCETNIFRPVDAEVKFYKYRFPILFFRGVLKATLSMLCFILLTSNFTRWN